MKKIWCSVVLILCMGSFFLSPVLFAQTGTVTQVKLTDFELQSSAVITVGGKELSVAAYRSKIYWFPVKVPSTVLTGLVANKVYPDPYSGLNNMLIPDASDEFNEKYQLERFSHLPGHSNPWKKPYWYRTTFQVPAKDKSLHFQLIFKGINYRAEVWLNGSLVADSAQMAGMFAEYSLDVSKQVITGGENVLAVRIFPLDHPGVPAEEQLKALGGFFANGGPTGDIGKNVTMLSSVGWDWIPPVRDRNMGIWQPVYLRTSGTVTIARPHLITRLPDLPDTGVAKLSLELTLCNNSPKKEKGKLTGWITPENFSGKPVRFSADVSIDPGAHRVVKLDASDVKALLIQRPMLWWPNGYGKPNLYRICLQYSNNTYISDDTSFVFGIRTVDSKAVEVNGYFRRDFYVNGKRIHLTGGAWVPDMMLNRDSARYDHELHLCRNGNINLVRIWGGGVTPPDEFFNAADRYGLLVWSDFWVTADTQGEFKGSSDWPLESQVFISNLTSTIYRLRNHPSLLVWTGGNEGHARKELYDAMRNGIIELDGTRPFIPSSSGLAKLPPGWMGSWPDNKPAGVYSGGPYSWRDPREYYRLVDAGKEWLFKDETGIPSQPPLSTLPRIIPDLVWDTTLPFPLNNTWGYHDAAGGNGKYDLYYKEMVRRFGEPASVKDFSDKMQLLNAISYQGIFESVGHKLNETGGVMLWKLNAAFPSVIWQVYDWFLAPNAGYYFMQNACEPVHVQLNLNDSMIAVINRTYAPVPDLTVEAAIYGLDGRSLYKQDAKTSLSPAGVKKIVSLSSLLKGLKGVSFVVLNIKDATGKQVSHNVYWMEPASDYTQLKDMPAASLQVEITGKEKGNNSEQWKMRVSNPTGRMAFFINPRLMNNGEEILPCFWSANYFTLAPGESMDIAVSAPSAKIQGEVQLQIEGWNIEKKIVKL